MMQMSMAVITSRTFDLLLTKLLSWKRRSWTFIGPTSKLRTMLSVTVTFNYINKMGYCTHPLVFLVCEREVCVVK
jgi:hypothetical protein